MGPGVGWLKDAPFFVVACAIHGIILTHNPGIRWAAARSAAPEAALPVEFVQQLPPDPSLAPIPKGVEDMLVGSGPGAVIEEKAKPAAPKAKPPPKRRPLSPAERERLARRREESRAAMARVREERRVEAERRREEVLERRRVEAGRRAELMARKRAAAEERRRAEAARVADVESQLAMLPSPEEPIAEDAGTARGPRADPAPGKAPQEAAAPLPADTSDPVFELDGRGGRDAVNAKAAGGGFGEGGGGPVSWSLSGPAGTRRLLARRVPACPDWVSARGLDLSVRLKFRVLPDGAVGPGTLIQLTSGFPDLDRRAMEALRGWRFDAHRPKDGKAVPETWGVVTFRFVAG